MDYTGDNLQPRQTAGSPGPQRHFPIEELAGSLCESTGRTLGAQVRVVPAGLEQMRYADFLASLSEARCCWLIETTDGDLVWLELAEQLTGVIVDRLVGGPAAPGPPSRAPTAIERGILRRFVNAVAEALRRTWPSMPSMQIVSPAGKAPHRSDTRTGRSDPAEAVFVASLATTVANSEGMMRLCMPAKLAAVQARGPTGSGQEPGQYAPSDGSVELSVVAAEAEIPPDELAALAPGDVLVTDARADGELEVRLDGKESFAGRLGSRNGKRAVIITRPTDEQ